MTPKNVMISIGSELLTGYPENEVSVGSKTFYNISSPGCDTDSTFLILFSGISDTRL